jgi:hypothetical protein
MVRTIRCLLLCPTLSVLSFQPSYGQSDPLTNEYRITIVPSHPITENVSGFGYLGHVDNPQSDYSIYYLGYPGITYKVKPWFQIWAALLGIYTDNAERQTRWNCARLSVRSSSFPTSGR